MRVSNINEEFADIDDIHTLGIWTNSTVNSTIVNDSEYWGDGLATSSLISIEVVYETVCP